MLLIRLYRLLTRPMHHKRKRPRYHRRRSHRQDPCLRHRRRSTKTNQQKNSIKKKNRSYSNSIKLSKVCHSHFFSLTNKCRFKRFTYSPILFFLNGQNYRQIECRISTTIYIYFIKRRSQTFKVKKIRRQFSGNVCIKKKSMT